MKQLFGFAIMMLMMISVSAQDEVGELILLSSVPESKALVAQAQLYADAVASGKYRKVAEMTHEDIVKMGGGIEYIIGDLKNQGNQLAGQNLTYVNAEVGSHPEFIRAEGELQTVIPIVYKMKMNEKDVESWVNLFASSKDEGVNWTFVNLEKFDAGSFKEFVSNVSSDFVFPSK